MCSPQGPVFVLYTLTVYQTKERSRCKLSIRLELCQFSDKFWKTWRAEIKKLITLSRLGIILTCDIRCDILSDEITSLEINPYSRWRTFNHFRTLYVRIWDECFLYGQKACNTATPPFTNSSESTSRTGHNTGQSLVPPFVSSCCAERCEEGWPHWTHT